MRHTILAALVLLALGNIAAASSTEATNSRFRYITDLTRHVGKTPLVASPWSGDLITPDHGAICKIHHRLRSVLTIDTDPALCDRFPHHRPFIGSIFHARLRMVTACGTAMTTIWNRNSPDMGSACAVTWRSIFRTTAIKS
jgi:hypothetical protein